LSISELVCAVCRTSGAPQPAHATVMGSSQRVLPTVRAGRTPRGPPSLPPRPTPRTQNHRGSFWRCKATPGAPSSAPPLATTVPSTIGSGMGATCGGQRRPGTRVHQRSKARGGWQKRKQPRTLLAAGGRRRAGGTRHRGSSPWSQALGPAHLTPAARALGALHGPGCLASPRPLEKKLVEKFLDNSG
jgi:hypothetical protein